jgi:hypothetical protein
MQTIAKTNQGDNTQPPAIEPYAELMLKALRAALKYLPPEWSDGWLTLDLPGRRYLAEEGVSDRDLRIAINEGVRARLILRKLYAGTPCIALRERVVRQ